MAGPEIRCLKPLVWMDLAITTYDERRGSQQNFREQIGWKSWSDLFPRLRGDSLSHTEKLKNISTLQQWSNSSERLLSLSWSVCVCVWVRCFGFEWFAVCLHLYMLERRRCDIIYGTQMCTVSPFVLSTWFRGAGTSPARSTHVYWYCILMKMNYDYIYHHMHMYPRCRANCIRDHSERLYTCGAHPFVTILSYSHNTCWHVIQDQIGSTSDMLLFILNQSWTRKDGHRELSQDGC